MWCANARGITVNIVSCPKTLRLSSVSIANTTVPASMGAMMN